MPFIYIPKNKKPIIVISSSIFKTFFSRLLNIFKPTPSYINNFKNIFGFEDMSLGESLINEFLINTIPRLKKEGASYKEIKDTILMRLDSDIIKNSIKKFELYKLLIKLGIENNDSTIRDIYKKLLIEYDRVYGVHTEEFTKISEDFIKFIIREEKLDLRNPSALKEVITKEINKLLEGYRFTLFIKPALDRKLNELLFRLGYINTTELMFVMNPIDNIGIVELKVQDIVFPNEVKFVNANEPILAPGLQSGNNVITITNEAGECLVINQPDNVKLQTLVFQIGENFASESQLNINIFYKEKQTPDEKEKFEEFLSNFENQMAMQLEKEKFVVNQKQIAVTNNESIIIPGSTETPVFDQFEPEFLYNTDTWLLNLRRTITIKNFNLEDDKWVIVKILETQDPNETIKQYRLIDDDIINTFLEYKRTSINNIIGKWKEYIDKSLKEKTENISSNIEILTKLYETNEYSPDASLIEWKNNFENKLRETLIMDGKILTDHFDSIINTARIISKISPTKQQLIETLLEVIKPETIQTHPVKCIEFYNNILKYKQTFSNDKVNKLKEKMLNLFISGDIKNANYINVDQENRKMKNFVLLIIDPETKVENYHLISSKEFFVFIKDIMSYGIEQNLSEKDMKKLIEFKNTIIARDKFNNVIVNSEVQSKLNDYITNQLSLDGNITRINKELFDFIKSRNPDLANLSLENLKIDYSSINASIDHIDIGYNVGNEEYNIKLPISEFHEISDIVAHIAPIRENFFIAHH